MMEELEKLKEVVNKFLSRVTGAEVEKIKSIGEIYLKHLEIKEWMIQKEKVKVSARELEEEPTKMTSKVISQFKKI